MANREEFLKAGIDMGITDVGKLNQGLSSQGFEKLSKAEILMIQDGTYGKNLAQRFGQGITDLGSGLATILGGTYSYATDKNARNQINSMIGNELSKGLGGVSTDIANLILSPYNDLSIQKALTQSPKETITDIGAGINARPFNATLDILGVPYTSKLLGKAVGTTGKLLPDVKGFKTAKGIIEGLTDPTVKNVNMILNTSRDVPSYKLEGLRNEALSLYNKDNLTDLAQVYKNLETSKTQWSGTPSQIELTGKVKEFTGKINQLMVDAGIDPNKAREVAETQYVLRQLQNEGRNIPFDDVRKIINEDKGTLKKYGIKPEELNSKIKPLQTEARTAFDSGLIFPIRHGSLGTDTSAAIAKIDKGIATERRYGNQSFEDSAKGFYPNYLQLINELEKSDQALNALSEITKTVGKKVVDYNTPIKDSQIFVSPRKLREDIIRFLQGEGKLDTIINNITKLSEEDLAKYADDLYVLNKKDAEAFKNAFTNSLDTIRKQFRGLETISTIGKQVALGSPRYIAGNELTNLTLNSLEGVTPINYLQVLGEYNKYIPDVLKKSSSYTGYLDKDLPMNARISDVYKRLGLDFQKENALDKLKALNMGATYPVFYTAQGYEILDRSANYIKQAEKYAKQVNKTTEEILKEASAKGGNNATYRKIKSMVDNSLGDYTGRNYYINPNIDWVVRQTLFPFYRPYTQALRTLYHHTTDNPLRQQLFARVPARIGNQISENFEESGNNVNPSYGGFPVRAADNFTNSRVVYNPYHAYSALAEITGDPNKFFTSSNTFVTPLLSPLLDINRYGKPAKLPNSYTVGGKQLILDNNGNVTRVEDTNLALNKLRLFTSNIANSYLAPVSLINRVGLPITAQLLEQTYRTPSDYSLLGQIGDYKIPYLMEGREASRGKRTFGERILPMVGITIEDVYNKQDKPMTLKEQGRVRKSIMKQMKRIEE